MQKPDGLFLLINEKNDLSGEATMEPVPLQFDEGLFRYEHVERHGMLAIYTQTHKPSGTVRYEMVRLRHQKAKTWPNGSITPEREAYPGASAWGLYGFTFHSLADAQAYLATLQTTPEPPIDE